jgi:DNA protecting protein DprA
MNASALQNLQRIKGIGPKRSEAILQRLDETGRSLDDFFALSVTEIKQQFNLPINVAEAIVQSITEEQPVTATAEEDALITKGIKILKRGTPEYPKRLARLLGDKAPDILYVWGNTDLFNKPAVGFCGSREASEKSIEIAADTARQIVEEGWVVVSGHARGVDTAAHQAALKSGGGTIIVAPEGILSFKLRRELKQIAKPEQILIVSQFPPAAGWAVGRAMGRNSTIIGLSDAMVLVSARAEGGTFEAGKTALRLRTPLFVARYESPGESAAGNRYFLDRGAYQLSKKESTGKPNTEYLLKIVKASNELFQEAKEAISSEAAKPHQLPLVLT